MTPPIFLSSIMNGYEDYRAAARRGVIAAGARPLMIEDRGPVPTSSRNACLDLVGAADGLILVAGLRGGSRAPSRKLIVEEEFDEAQRLGLPAWLFVQRGDRDADAAGLVERLSQYVGGRYRADFETPSELETLCRTTLEGAVDALSKPPLDPLIVQEVVGVVRQQLPEPAVRFAISPKRQGEFVDPLQMDREVFRHSLIGAAHEVRFFDYGFASKPAVSADTVVITQVDRRDTPVASLRLVSSGLLVAERRVVIPTEVRTLGSDMLSPMFEVLASDVSGAVESAFGVVAAIVHLVDPYERFPDFQYNVALLGSGQRRIVDALANTGRYMTGWQQVQLVVAYDAPRSISRAALRSPRDEVERGARMLRKRLDDAHRV